MATHIKISTITVGSGGAASIDFTSIPATYTDLKLVCSLRNNSAAAEFYVTFNGSGSSYSDKWLYGNGSAAGSTSNAVIDLFSVQSSFTANTFSSSEIYIPNYTSSDYKSVSSNSVQETNGTAAYALLEAGLWSNTAVINQITLTPSGSNTFVQYSSATLYGIKSS